MKLIYNSNNAYTLFLGSQSIDGHKNYRMSKYCITEKINDTNLIYNKLTGKFFILDEFESQCISKSPIKYFSKLDEMIREWILVTDEFDELKLAEQMYNINNTLSDGKNITTFTILTTSDCNARCYYCYEKGGNHYTMTKETALDVAKFIEKKSNGSRVNLKWFGGEPLYNSSVIDIICEYLNNNGIEYVSSMVSNAYLFNENLIDKAKRIWNLKKIQITLDGTAEIYNKIKNYKNSNSNPFKTVTDNIELLAQNEIYLNIRLNISRQNHNDIKELVEWLDKRYVEKKYLTVYIALLYDIYDKSKNEILEMIELRNELTKSLYDKKFNNHIRTFKKLSVGCMAQSSSSVVISPQGLLSKCEHFFEGEHIFGSIYDDDYNFKKINYWKHRTVFPECNNCPDYLHCMGYDRCPNFRPICELTRKKREFDNKLDIQKVYDNYLKNNQNEI